MAWSTKQGGSMHAPRCSRPAIWCTGPPTAPWSHHHARRAIKRPGTAQAALVHPEGAALQYASIRAYPHQTPLQHAEAFEEIFGGRGLRLVAAAPADVRNGSKPVLSVPFLRTLALDLGSGSNSSEGYCWQPGFIAAWEVGVHGRGCMWSHAQASAVGKQATFRRSLFHASP